MTALNSSARATPMVARPKQQQIHTAALARRNIA
jgi:hypothetical protein